MKTLHDYHRLLYILLGDASGRRYTTDILDLALQEALGTFRKYCPNKHTVRVKIAKMDGPQGILNWFPAPDEEILTIRNEKGTLLNAAEYRTGGKTILTFYGPAPRPAAGDELLAELSLPHTIRDLDEAPATTVPDSFANTLCTGAAASALRIRARSVTEVFGKRPEDAENLAEQARLMERLFTDALKAAAWDRDVRQDPWPRYGFSV